MTFTESHQSNFSPPPPIGERQLQALDRLWIGIALAVPLAGLCLTVVEGGTVSLPGNFGLHLPPMCGSRTWLGVDCPLCGLTRSIIHFMHGEVARSWETHRLGWLVLVAIVGQIPYRLLIGRRKRLRDSRWKSFEVVLWASLGLLFIGNRIWILAT